MKLSSGQRRFLIAGSLGTIFGFVCAYLASSNGGPGFWWSPMMWMIVTSRMLIGLIVGLAGAYKHHPLFGFKINPFLRGAVLGAITSVPLATGTMISPIEATSPWNLFWATMMMGVIYGMIIDFVATKWGGEGKEVLKS